MKFIGYFIVFTPRRFQLWFCKRYGKRHKYGWFVGENVFIFDD